MWTRALTDYDLLICGLKGSVCIPMVKWVDDIQKISGKTGVKSEAK